ncbi:hypothetical protein UFOVP1049_54 [uncultured Caudovirales phage]|uniref:Uncharacterized protein n=1 Tax=uncultured Caudovirales phage TaxID=2100421 RepID=A0A6J5Q8F5_9CAUD|nr:hypothetical protein UFOVP1049_54 [uncultured Caudovirales phage]
MNNEQVMQLMADNGMHEGGMDNWVIDNAWFKFANLVEAQEREAWEHKFARLQNLMDIREIQPNKPCCLAARADERKLCTAVVRQRDDLVRTLEKAEAHIKFLEDEIRTRGLL